jgi:hypothetical protein
MNTNIKAPLKHKNLRSRMRIVALGLGSLVALGSATAITAAPVAGASPTAVACHGSLTGKALNAPVVGITTTPDQGGYWMVASDGGVFNYGDAGFYGSAGNIQLNKPIVGMAATPDGKGYWLVASDGGIFNYGDAVFHGSAGNIHLNEPIIGMAATYQAGGYWLAAADGGVFSYGIARYLGGGPISQDVGPVVTDFSAFATSADGGGYLLATANRAFLLNFGTAKYFGLGSSTSDTSSLAGVTSPSPLTGYSYWEATQAGSVYALSSSGQTTC